MELLCGAEVVAYLPDDLALGSGTAAYETVREVVQSFPSDRRLDGESLTVEAVVAHGRPSEALGSTIGGRPDREETPSRD